MTNVTAVAMASPHSLATTDSDPVIATHQVLGTTELLEQILLDLAAQDQTAEMHLSPCRPLFRLQRVNRKFNHTIAKSLPLRCRMMLDQDGDDDERRPFGIDYAFNERTSLLSFVRNSYRNDVQDAVNIRSKLEKHCVVNLIPSECYSSDGSTRIWHLQTRPAGSTTKSSLRGMKLCSHPQPVSVFLYMTIEPGMHYVSMLAFDQGDETLGVLVDGVDEVLNRSRDEHIGYMKVHRELSPLFTEVVTYGRRPRLDIPSIMNAPEVVRLREATRLHSLRADCGRVTGTCAFCGLAARGKYTQRMMRDIGTGHIA